MHRGYIKLWRRVQDSFIWRDAQALQIWVHLLVGANYKDTEFMFNEKKQTLRRGQLINGLNKLSSATGVSKSKCYRVLQMLESENLIEIQETNRYSIITIVKYDEYQSIETLNETPAKLQRNSGETPVETSKALKELKRKEKKETSLFDFESLWTKYPSKVGKEAAARHFNSTVATEKDYQDINTALNNYIGSERVRKGFIQNGSTWFNNWRDWVVSPEAQDNRLGGVPSKWLTPGMKI